MANIGNIVGHGVAHGFTDAVEPAFRGIRYDANFRQPNALPPLDEILTASYNGYVHAGDLLDVVAHYGARLDVTADLGIPDITAGTDYSAYWWRAVYQSEQHRPTEKETLEIANRWFHSDVVLQADLRRYGYITDDYRKQVANLRYDIPGPSDLVRFSVRHVWEPDLVSKLGYDLEFPGQIIDLWHAMKGLDYPLFSGPFADQVAAYAGSPAAGGSWQDVYALYDLPEPTWARAYWWSHWVLPSPGQFFDMLIRLDPQRDRSFDPPEAVGLDFTLADYELGLRANDYPEPYRRRLAAINRPIVGVRFLRSFVDTDVYTYDDIVEWARRWGYSPRDRVDIANNIWKTVKEKKQKASACKGCQICEEAFDVGLLPQADLQSCYEGYGATKEDALRLAQQAWLKVRVKRGKEIVANVRKRFLRGTISENDARNLLGGWGIDLERIDWYIQDWKLEFEAGRKEISAQQAVKYACQGFISGDDLQFRLTNLGYSPADIQAMDLAVIACQADLAAKALSKQNRQDRQAKADAYSACRRQRQLVIETQRYLASHGTPKDLQKWFCEGSIGECEVYSRLNALGWPDTDITRYLSDCKSGKKPSLTCPPGKPVIPPEWDPNSGKCE